MIIRIATMLLLCSASLSLLASEGHATGDDGDGGCPTTPGADERDVTGATGAQGADAESTSNRDKTSRPRRGGNAENGVRSPRMHNLLPGMFR